MKVTRNVTPEHSETAGMMLISAPPSQQIQHAPHLAPGFGNMLRYTEFGTLGNPFGLVEVHAMSEVTQ